MRDVINTRMLSLFVTQQPPSPVTLSPTASWGVAASCDALRSGKIFQLVLLFSPSPQFFPSTTGSTRDKKNISVLMSVSGFDAKTVNSVKYKSLWWIPESSGPDLSVWYKQGRLCLCKEMFPGVSHLIYWFKTDWILSKAHHSNSSTCTKVVKTWDNQLYPAWKKMVLLW